MTLPLLVRAPFQRPAARVRRLIPRLATTLTAVVLAACATSYAPTGVHPGDTRDSVVARMGPPTATHATADGGTRLEYSHKPEGLQTWMIDLDASGHVTRWQQVLDEAHFAQVGPGLTEAQVLLLLGAPSERGHYSVPVPADTWMYRYDGVPHCTIFQLELDVDTHRTKGQGDYLPDPRCGMTR